MKKGGYLCQGTLNIVQESKEINEHSKMHLLVGLYQCWLYNLVVMLGVNDFKGRNVGFKGFRANLQNAMFWKKLFCLAGKINYQVKIYSSLFEYKSHGRLFVSII